LSPTHVHAVVSNHTFSRRQVRNYFAGGIRLTRTYRSS